MAAWTAASDDEDAPSHPTVTQAAALQSALSECWTLCNTLADLSSGHRIRTFRFSGHEEMQLQAWQSCWRLCQQLYRSRDQDHATHVVPTLQLCRDFCQSLFEARQRTDLASDSVLRVSFELNNHFYNQHDRTLPNAFNERTLDFYITMCHRLMKQRTSLPHDTDALLRACWSLAEILFNMRQTRREGGAPDEDLLGSAMQACWELCDLFREGWTNIRPDRDTPKPTQTTFPPPASSSGAPDDSRLAGSRSTSSLSGRKFLDAHPRGPPPETPTTIFDDTTTATSSPSSATVPNILVLGPGSSSASASAQSGTRGAITASHHDRWTTDASVVNSVYSESVASSSQRSTSQRSTSQRSSSTATAPAAARPNGTHPAASADSPNLLRLRYLVLKAGLAVGHVRSRARPLPEYALNHMPPAAFGTSPEQQQTLSLYRRLVCSDASMATIDQLPPRHLSAVEAAAAVDWLAAHNAQWAWMRDLYRFVFGFAVPDAERRGGEVMV